MVIICVVFVGVASFPAAADALVSAHGFKKKEVKKNLIYKEVVKMRKFDVALALLSVCQCVSALRLEPSHCGSAPDPGPVGLTHCCMAFNSSASASGPEFTVTCDMFKAPAADMMKS